MNGRPRVRQAVIGWAALALLVGALGGWALHVLLSPPADVLNAPGYTLVTAEHGKVGQVLQLNSSAGWEVDAVLANQARGTVTSVDVAGGTVVKQGSKLYTVDLRPVVVAAGAVPAFRDLTQGIRGADVAQLQAMLAALGHASGAPDGVFDAGVSSAVRAWQRGLKVPVDGVVRQGDVVFVPSLPTRLALDPKKVTTGAALSGGEPAVQVLPTTPVFSIALAENQSRLIKAGMRVDISVQNGSWRAEVTAVTAREGGFTAKLGGVDGKPICAEDCATVPYGEAVLLPSSVHIVPEREGITVPAAAVVTAADGRTGVVLESGGFQPVRVLSGASGMVVVEGIEVGTRVRAPGEPPAGAAP